MEIVLNPDLVQHPLAMQDRTRFLTRVMQPDALDKSQVAQWRGQPYTLPTPRFTDVQEGRQYHLNYLEYVDRCYARHMGVVVAPHLLWYVILAELAAHTKANAEHYRPLFTRSEGKMELLVDGIAEDGDSIGSFLPALRAAVPVSPDLFLPEFSTATLEYNLAATAAFMDAVSPYYDYSMKLCGIPRIRVEGTAEDWDRFVSHLGALQGRLDLAKSYFDQVISIGLHIFHAVKAEQQDTAWWTKMFYTEVCGSGHQEKVLGWLTDLFMTRPRLAYVTNFPTCVSVVKVKQKETGAVFAHHFGLFSSQVEGEYLVPSFDRVTRLVEQAAAHPQPSIQTP